MRTLLKLSLLILLIVGCLLVSRAIRDKQQLQEELIRLHVIANSDSEEDQSVKLQVRDAILSCLEANMPQCADKVQAQAYLLDNLQTLEDVANATLQQAGFTEKATVTLDKEAFDTRHYDTFSLPAGVYDSLLVKIGDAKGQNWWCVAFPTLCLPATSTQFRDTAVSAGLDAGLADTLAQPQTYEIRFFLLDCLGALENFFFRR